MINCYYTLNSAYLVDGTTRYKRVALRGPDRYADTERLSYDEWKPLKQGLTNRRPVEMVIDPFGSPFQAPETKPVILHILHESSERGIYTSPIVHIEFDVTEDHEPERPTE